jgi:hypothetical protein
MCAGCEQEYYDSLGYQYDGLNLATIGKKGMSFDDMCFCPDLHCKKNKPGTHFNICMVDDDGNVHVSKF